MNKINITILILMCSKKCTSDNCIISNVITYPPNKYVVKDSTRKLENIHFSLRIAGYLDETFHNNNIEHIHNIMENEKVIFDCVIDADYIYSDYIIRDLDMLPNDLLQIIALFAVGIDCSEVLLDSKCEHCNGQGSHDCHIMSVDCLNCDGKGVLLNCKLNQ